MKKISIVFIFIAVMTGLSTFYYGFVKDCSVTNTNGVCLVLDAGHGGLDVK